MRYTHNNKNGLIGEVHFIDDEAMAAAHEVPGRFAQMTFDFQLRPAANRGAEQRSNRPRALQEA